MKKDPLDQLITHIAQSSEAGEATGPHPEDELFVAFLSGRLPGGERRDFLAHVSGCGHCVDALELAHEMGAVDAFPRAHSVTAEMLELDIGPVLMGLSAAVSMESVNVTWSDAEMRVGLATALRRGRKSGTDGVSFVQRFADGTLRLEMQGAARDQVHISVSLTGAPADMSVSVICGGRLVATEPFVGEQVVLRGLPLRTCVLRLETPRGVLGHCRLELEAIS